MRLKHYIPGLALLLCFAQSGGSIMHAGPAGSADAVQADAIVAAAGSGTARERLLRIVGGRAGWPTEAQAAEQFKILRSSDEFAPVNALSHAEKGKDVDRIRRVLAPLFELHGGSTLIVSVLKTSQPVLGIGRGSVLLISSGLLQVLNDEELFALSAHEVAHQYFRREFARALDAGDKPALRLIELKCDAIAVLSILILNGKPESLARGLEWAKGTAYDLGAGDTSTHPDLKVRKQMIARLAA